jgi:hypothetical protein
METFIDFIVGTLAIVFIISVLVLIGWIVVKLGISGIGKDKERLRRELTSEFTWENCAALAFVGIYNIIRLIILSVVVYGIYVIISIFGGLILNK